MSAQTTSPRKSPMGRETKISGTERIMPAMQVINVAFHGPNFGQRIDCQIFAPSNQDAGNRLIKVIAAQLVAICASTWQQISTPGRPVKPAATESGAIGTGIGMIG